jgi:AraC-like DNA-binding protein
MKLVYKDYASFVREWEKEGHKIKRQIAAKSKMMIKEFMKKISLREVSRRTKLSPTYLSHILNGKTQVSISAYSKLVDFRYKF